MHPLSIDAKSKKGKTVRLFDSEDVLCRNMMPILFDKILQNALDLTWRRVMCRDMMPIFDKILQNDLDLTWRRVMSRDKMPIFDKILQNALDLTWRWVGRSDRPNHLGCGIK
jgi:hypothetical protein